MYLLYSFCAVLLVISLPCEVRDKPQFVEKSFCRFFKRHIPVHNIRRHCLARDYARVNCKTILKKHQKHQQHIRTYNLMLKYQAV
jgi:hypothetical protein